MLPKYEAIEITSFISENSGHTKPWVVMANTPMGLKYFVVKLYTTNQVDDMYCINNEVFCNILASEFNLATPKCALIEIPDSITMNLPSEQQLQLYNSDPRPKFATELISNVTSAVSGLPKHFYKGRIQMDMLYAFDNLIRNGDRGHPKPNLLLAPNDAYLIDHELAFRSRDIVNVNIDVLQLEGKFTKEHLFYSYLKKAQFKTKQNYFNEFSEYINRLNISVLNQYNQDLNAEGFNDNLHEVLPWLNQVKQKFTMFVNLLRGSLT